MVRSSLLLLSVTSPAAALSERVLSLRAPAGGPWSALLQAYAVRSGFHAFRSELQLRALQSAPCIIGMLKRNDLLGAKPDCGSLVEQ